MNTVGIIGFGSFGKFLAENLDTHVKVLVRSEKPDAERWRASMDEIAKTDYIVLAVPLHAYAGVLEQLVPIIRPETVIVDVCSVKESSLSLIRQYLPNQPLVATHPLFGPESARDSLERHTIVMCPDESDESSYAVVKDFAISLGLDVVEMSAREHDIEMATVQGLTFFIARTLDDLGVHSQKLHTPSFKRLLSLAELEKHHSRELFATIQNGNEHTFRVRQKFLNIADEINKDLNQTID